jgi:hypothetical protein
MAELLVALAEFDRRRLWIPIGHASLFYFLHRELGLSKGVAFYRKTAAELIQRFPEWSSRCGTGACASRPSPRVSPSRSPWPRPGNLISVRWFIQPTSRRSRSAPRQRRSLAARQLLGDGLMDAFTRGMRGGTSTSPPHGGMIPACPPTPWPATSPP